MARRSLPTGAFSTGTPTRRLAYPVGGPGRPFTAPHAPDPDEAEAHALNTPVVCPSCRVLVTPATHNVGDCEWYRERVGR